MRIEELDVEKLNGFYKDIAIDLGIEVAVKIFDYYAGLQVVFPTKFENPDYIHTKINEEYDGNNAKLLARKYGYSERWLRKILASEKNKQN